MGIKLKALLEKVSFDKLRNIERGLKKKHGQKAYGPGTFGVEFEFGDPDAVDVDIDELIWDNESEIVDYLERYEPGSFLSDYQDWMLDEHPSPQSVDDWEYDNPEPESLEDWESYNEMPKENDFEDLGDFEEAYSDWDDQRDEIIQVRDSWEDEKSQIEDAYDEWERDFDDYKEEFANHILNSDNLMEYLDHDEILDIVGNDGGMSDEIENVRHYLRRELKQNVGYESSKTDWEVHEDSGIEIASRHLTMKDFPLVAKLMKHIYTNYSVSGNQSAHVHVGIEEMDDFDIIVMSTLVDEDALMNDLSPDRELGQWAQLNTVLHKRIIEKFENTIESSGKIMDVIDLRDLYKGSRYFGTNLQSTRRRNTIEFRYFSSQIVEDPKKFFKWIKYFLLLPQVAKSRKQAVLGNEKGKRIILKRLPGKKVGVIFEKNLQKIRQPQYIKPKDMKGYGDDEGYSWVNKMDKDERKEFIKKMKELRKMDKMINPNKYKPIAAENIKLKNLITKDCK